MKSRATIMTITAAHPIKSSTMFITLLTPRTNISCQYLGISKTMESLLGTTTIRLIAWITHWVLMETTSTVSSHAQKYHRWQQLLKAWRLADSDPTCPITAYLPRLRQILHNQTLNLSDCSILQENIKNSKLRLFWPLLFCWINV